MKRQFDFDGATKLENYVRRRYRNQLNNGALSFYLCAFPHLERKGLGLCQPITANYRQLAESGFRSHSRLREVLRALDGVLCEVSFGTPIKGDKEATRLRRYSLHELMNGEPRCKLVDYTPADARRLAEILSNRTFTYGDSPTCRPHWNVSKTGRVTSSRPNVQGDGEDRRAARLCAGLLPGQVLIHADYKAAEPTIIEALTGYSFGEDPYQAAADLLGIDREGAKPKVNGLAYQRDSRAALGFWQCPPAEENFLPYVEALTEYKEQLYRNGKPRNRKRRYVNTLSGRRIEADRGKSSHRGQILSWQVQGTVADILNAACLKIIDMETTKGWRLCFPEHDSVYVIGKEEHAKEIQRIMEDEAARLEQPLSAKIETFIAGDVVRK